GPHRHEHGHLKEGDAERKVHGRKPAKEPDDSGQRDDQRADVQRAASWRKPQRECDEEVSQSKCRALPRRHPRVSVVVFSTREVAIGVARVIGKQTLEIVGREISRVGVEQLTRAIRRRALQMRPICLPTLANASRAYWRSSRVCVAVTIVRTLALSRATVGNPIACANTPASNNRSDN